MKKGTGKLLAGIAITGAFCYKAAKRMGIIDRIRYKDEYEALDRYVKSHYPTAKVSPLEETDTGFVCVVTKPEGSMILLSMTEASDGVYVFSEKNI